MGLVRIPFLTADGKEDYLDYELLDHSLANKWQSLVKKTYLLGASYLPDLTIHGGNIIPVAELVSRIAASLSYLTPKFPEIYREDIFTEFRSLKPSADQNFLNLAHVFFEKAYHDAFGDKGIADPEMGAQLRTLNTSIHQIESSYMGNEFLVNSRHSLGEIKMKIEPAEYALFHPERQWGYLYLNYCHIGESYISVWLNNYPVEPVPQTELSSDVFLSFITEKVIESPAPFLEWLENHYGKKISLKEIPVGFAPIGKISGNRTHEEFREFFQSHPEMGRRIIFSS